MMRAFLVLTLSFAGHSRDAVAVADSSTLSLLPAEAVLLAIDGALSERSARALFGRWENERDVVRLVHALPWLAAVRDTIALSRLERLFASVVEDDVAGQSSLAAYGIFAARAYGALARGDSAAALEWFVQAPDSVCPWSCSTDRVVVARLMSSRGRVDDAADWLDARPPSPGVVSRTEVAWSLERARLAERRAERDYARRLYGFVAAAWRNGDSSSGVRAAEARRALARLR